MEFDENQIVAACQSGDWRDFDQLYDYYLPKIFRYIYNRIHHKQITEDITSTVFMKVVQNLSRYKSEGAPLGAWIYRIARNTVIDHVRTSKPTQDLETAAGSASTDDVAGDVNTKLNLDAIRAGISRLSEFQREVVELRVWDQLSHREIADILEISEDSSKVAFSRALSELKQTIRTT